MDEFDVACCIRGEATMSPKTYGMLLLGNSWSVGGSKHTWIMMNIVFFKEAIDRTRDLSFKNSPFWPGQDVHPPIYSKHSLHMVRWCSLHTVCKEHHHQSLPIALVLRGPVLWGVSDVPVMWKCVVRVTSVHFPLINYLQWKEISQNTSTEDSSHEY